MIRQAELARLWKVSREYVSKLCKKGCPLTSVEDANKWRAALAGRPRSGSTASVFGEEKPPITPKVASEPPVSGVGIKTKSKRKGGQTGKQDGSLEGALNAAISAQLKAAEIFNAAIESGKPALIGPMLSIHTRAIEARFAAERAFRDEQQKRNILIPVSDAYAMFRKGWDLVLGRLKRLPQSKCTACNPSNPRMAFDVLEASINQIIADAQKEYQE